MRRNLSKKQITAMGLAAMMAVQTPAMAAEVENSPETSVQETLSEETQEQAEDVSELQTETQPTEFVSEAETETQTQTEAQEELAETTVQVEEITSDEISETEIAEEVTEEIETDEAELESEQSVDEYVLAENQEVLTDGWHQDSDGNFTYVKDGKLIKNKVIEIDGRYYGFNYNGIMYVNQSFDMWNPNEETSYAIYRAKEDGSLYVNEWYIEYSRYYYYYGEEGQAASGLREVDGTLYYFYQHGERYQNQGVTIDGKNYYCKADGTVVELQNDGWTDIDGNYLYVKDGQILSDCVEKIGDHYYGFMYNGVRYSNTYFYIWDSESETSIYYRAKEDGSLYVNEWYIGEFGENYYYGEEGKAASGLQEVDGTLYYFSESGQKEQNQSVTVDGKNYYCKQNGAVVELQNDGWTDVDGDYLYVKDGQILSDCVEKIGDHYYGFMYNGVRYSNTYFYIWDSESETSIYYQAKEDGSLCVNEWYIGELGESYYYGEEGKAASGLQEVDGILYYFSESGQKYKNQSVTIDGKNYYCKADGTVVELQNDGWTDIDGDYLYVKDGQILSDCVEKIGDRYYGFNYDGIMYSNTSFGFWNSESETDTYYRARKDGSLYVNEWYVDEWGNSYYYGEEGKAVSGLKEVDGTLYYFTEYGKRYQEQGVAVDGKNYYCKSDGTLVELQNNNGWNQVDGNYLYVKDGQILENCIEKIGDRYYGFNYNGIMYSNTSFGFWNSESRAYEYYRAKKDGSLYVNEWYGEYTKYYYGEEGKAYSGIQTVDGILYYFDSNGEIRRNYSGSENGKYYYCDNYGTVFELKNSGWNKVEDNKYLYVKDGQILQECVAEIDGAYYAFNSSGIMYQNSTFNIWKPEGSDYYWASSSGALYTNTWYYGDETYYYGADAKRCKGLQMINGIQYAFDNDGRLIKDGTFTEDGINYYCDASGRMSVMPNNQWYEGDNESWYYVQDGTVLKDCSAQIGGNWYAFDSEGKMKKQGFNVNLNGTLRTNTWFFDGSYWYYYGEDGQPCESGIHEIAGVKYLFEDGKMVVSAIGKANGSYYVVDANGYLSQAPQDGWVFAGNNYYYMENGNLITSSTKEIAGSYYAFDESGKMYQDEEITSYFSSIKRRARVDGSLYVSQWYQDKNGSWYYYGQDAIAVSDKVEINGTVYLFDSSSRLKINGAILDGQQYYLADQNGVWIQTPGWVQNDGSWYYVQKDGSLYTGVLENGGKRYYMNPVMLVNIELKVVDEIVYTIDANGVMTIVPDGFYRDGMSYANMYYVSDGKSIGMGWQQIDDKWYYFQSGFEAGMSGAVCDCIVGIKNKRYLFDQDGALVSAGWHLYDSSWYYTSASGELVTGDTWINGKLYHFAEDGELKTGLIVEDGVCKLYNEDGSLLETGSGQGWNLLGGQYYYLREGSLLKSGAYKLPDGKWYCFDSNGIMQTNTLFYNCWCGETGAAKTGWFMIAGNWYYASPDTAVIYKGLQVINGVKYYFNTNGVMQTKDVLIDEKLITINGSGAVTGVKAVNDGWGLYEGEWYYYKNGKPYTGWVGVYYIRDGKMLNNILLEWKNKTYYLGKDGAYLSNGWSSDGEYYAKADGTLAKNEWLSIDGKWHYFNENFQNTKFKSQFVGGNTMETGVYTKEGEYISSNGYAQGWLLINGNYYYKEGEDFIIDQLRKINGDWYLFDAHGKMVTGFSKPEYDQMSWLIYYYDRGKFYYGSDGRRCNYTGWKVIDGNWYYFNENSEAVDGWRLIGGVKYYFGETNHFMYTGYKVIDGSLYYFNASGACKGVERTFTGWHQEDGDWYYIKNGKAVTGTTVIGGTLYQFGSTGVWISD